MDVIALLKQLIAIDSINPFWCKEINGAWILKGNEHSIAARLEELLKQAGFTTSRQHVHTDADGIAHYNILGQKGEGTQSLLLYGHMDTVTAGPWLSYEDALAPKEVRKIGVNHEERDILLGLGAADMKAGIAAICCAVQRIKPQGYVLKVAFGVDEEYYSLGSHILAQSDFFSDVAAVIVPEMSDGPNAGGPRTISLGRLGRCEVLVTVSGTGGHGAHVNEDTHINAAVSAAAVISCIEEIRKSFSDTFRFVDTSHPGVSSYDTIHGSLYVNKVEVGDGTLSIPNNGSISISCSYTPMLDSAKVLHLIQKNIDTLLEQGRIDIPLISGKKRGIQVRLRPRPTPHSDAYCISPIHPFPHFVKGILEGNFGFEGYNMGYSVADENVFVGHHPNIPVLCIGPRGGNCHRADEWVDIQSVRELETLFVVLGSNYFNYLKIL